jgi:hypothetical protein
MATRYSAEHAGRRVELWPDRDGVTTRLRLLVDGEQVAVARPRNGRNRIEGGGVAVLARLTPLATISTAEILVEGEEPVPMDPEPGTRAARIEAFARRHPGLFAGRHVVRGVARVLLPLLGVGLLVNLLPRIPIHIDAPDIPWPDLPDIPVPDVDVPSLPGWVDAILATTHYWLPILIGLIIAVRERNRRRRQAAARAGRAGAAEGEARPPAA